jgi:hypothetical protein
LSERKEVLEKSGLCLFCLKHAAELECYGRGGLSKPRCTQAGCDGEHTPSVHKLMGEESAGVNLVAEDESELKEDEDEDEDEEWWVGTIGVMGARDDGEKAPEEMDESEPEEGTHPFTSSCTRRSDSGLESEPEHPLGIHPAEELEEDGWWNPGTPQPSSEEGEGRVQYLGRVRDIKPQGREPTLEEDVGGLEEEKPWKGWLPHPKGAKRRKLRKETERTRDQEWEMARQDAWLREMLSDT